LFACVSYFKYKQLIVMTIHMTISFFSIKYFIILYYSVLKSFRDQLQEYAMKNRGFCLRNWRWPSRKLGTITQGQLITPSYVPFESNNYWNIFWYNVNSEIIICNTFAPPCMCVCVCVCVCVCIHTYKHVKIILRKNIIF